MKKVITMLLMLALILCTTGCVWGEAQETVETTKHKMLLNKGSCFVYTFQDSETGVWYISTSEGVTPRLNADGTLYVSEVND